MTTSYFSKYKGDNGVSIATVSPFWFIGEEYKKIAPKHWMVRDYSQGKITKDTYKEVYIRDVLDKLDPQEVYDEIVELCGPDAVLLSWESPNILSSRNIVAEWLNTKLGTQITELQTV